MSRRGATLGVALSLAGLLALAGSQVRVPYVGLGPGPLYNTLGSTPQGRPLIVVPKDRDHPAGGELNLTTVNVYSELTLVDAVVKWFDGDYAVLPRDLIFPKGQSEQEANEENEAAMVESQDHAKTVALCELGTPVTSRIVVSGLQDDGPAAKAGIAKDDQIAEIDGRPVDSLCTLRRLTALRKPGDTISVTVRRDGAERTFALRTGTAETGPDGRPLLGVQLEERDQKEPFPVTIAVDDVGGPSAGLMFALGIYDRLTPGDLTGGNVIAGTGTIDDDGNVGAIGGIQQKLVAARAYGARWFLTPAGNYDTAAGARPDGLTLVKVATFKEALAAVRAIAEGRTPAT
ncbi:MAG TPA: PDZ domain-containing protein [Frankiaceae bacterium]|jgi:PDZ domain-containing protein|nr:PDZ domain-containing protein [Frankiaceae bacterium]